MVSDPKMIAITMAEPIKEKLHQRELKQERLVKTIAIREED